jgi:ABC-2 type transport system permease protein
MTRSVTWELVKKDWWLYRMQIVISTAAGVAALGLCFKGGEVAGVIGAVWIFTALVIVACMLPVSAIVNERKKQHLPFVMSLPISVREYTAAKLVSSVGMFLMPWLVLVAATVALIEVRGFLPKGSIPFAVIVLLLPFVGFCLITGSALVGESEGWTIAATVACNSSYWLAWFLIARTPGMMDLAKGNTSVWNGQLLWIVAGELAVIAGTLALTFFLQSRKRDFI